MGQQFKRSSRIGVQILRDISTMYDRELGEHLGGLITFTHVKVSDDLRYATVYYSFIGDGLELERVQNVLEAQAKRIRKEIGKGLNIRHIPEFTFKFDPSIKEGIRIEQLLNEIKQDDEQRRN
ncbi:MAG: 30S ribosome-binding factor RbfA [bacterium]|nr:30S ribosome-binding factor RbfA [bacterium]